MLDRHVLLLLLNCSVDGTMEENGFSSINYIEMTDDIAETEKLHFYSASKTKCFNTFKELLFQIKEKQVTQQGLKQ